MKTVGHRCEPELSPVADGRLLAQGVRFTESLAPLAQSTFIPRGVYRFASHEAANRHQLDCLAQGMALLAARRA
jgi:hypothetical protein